jgi:hypothetical protein
VPDAVNNYYATQIQRLRGRRAEAAHRIGKLRCAAKYFFARAVEPKKICLCAIQATSWNLAIAIQGADG